MLWSDIRDHYSSACGQAEGAAGEALIHLSEGQRTISARLDLEDTETVEENVLTTVGVDYVLKPTGIYRIIHIFEYTSGQDLHPEDGGVRGRAQFLAKDTGMPPTGPPKWYAISGGKIWLRPTPDLSTYDIRIRGKAQMPDLTEADWGMEPTLPDQYHMAIAWAAALSFLSAHPTTTKELGVEHVQLLERQIDKALIVQELPKDRERFDKRGRMYLRGFRTRMR